MGVIDYSRLKLFGTEAFPLRPSRLGDWMRCPWKAAMEFLAESDRDSGKAADTGSACHAMVAAWHNDPQKRANVALGVAWTRVSEFPLADLGAAEKFFRYYIADPRNQQAEVIAVEKNVSLTIQAAKADPTQEAIVIRGTLDQLRRDPSGGLSILDLKCGGRLAGFEMVTEHAIQLACYQVAASEVFGEPVYAATIIRVQDYLPETKSRKPGKVFWDMPFGLREARAIVDGLRDWVAGMRAGRVWAMPSGQCNWCSLGGLSSCLPLLQEYKNNAAK